MILDKNLTDKEKADRLCEELGRLKDDRAAYEPTWNQAQHMVSNVTLSFDVTEADAASGFKKPKRITDRPAQYKETLTAGLCGYGVNPNIKWMKLGLGDEKAAKAYGVKDWLEAVEQAECDEFDNMNFYTEMKMVIDQAVDFGLGVMHIDEDKADGKVRYKQISLPEVFLDTNEHNEYETVFRRFFMTVENLISRFGLDRMSDNIKTQWKTQDKSANRSQKIEVLHAVFRRKNRKGASERNTDMPYASFFVDVAAKHIIEESGYRSFPYAIFVWERVGGKNYPISPAIKALNDIELLHVSEETRMDVAEMAARTPIAMPESMRGAYDIFGEDGYIRPGTPIYYDKASGDQVPAAINLGNNYPITLEITNSQAGNIKDWFYVDFFLMLQQQQRIANMTATAVQALQGEKATVMTNMITNLKKALQVVVQRTYDIMSLQGRLPDLPAALLRPAGESGHRMDFTFASVLSQVQQTLLRYQGFSQFMPAAMAVANLGSAYPPAMEALDRYDFDAVLQNEARAAHLAETAIREDEEVEAIKAQRAQAKEAAARQQAAQAAAQDYGKLNEAPEPGSPAEALFGGRQ